MSTWQDDRVFDHGEADDAFSLNVVVCGRCCRILLSIHIGQVKDGAVVKELLLDQFEFKRAVSLDGEGAAGVLNRFLGPALVAGRKDRLNGDDDRVEVFPVVCQVVHLVLTEVQAADVAGELLLEARAEFVGVGGAVFLQVGVVVERGRLRVANLGRTQIHSDHALVVGIEDEVEFVLVCTVSRAD